MMALLPLVPGSASWDNVPVGTPPTAKVTGPGFPVTVAVIFAGVPSCGASAVEEERARLRAPDAPPKPVELPQAPRARQRDAEQMTAAFVKLRRFIASFGGALRAVEHPRAIVVHPRWRRLRNENSHLARCSLITCGSNREGMALRGWRPLLGRRRVAGGVVVCSQRPARSLG